jgi:hypothetical protein
MYKAENMSVLLKGGNILQYTTKVCKSMADFELNEFSLDDMRSMFFQNIKELCKEENRHMLKIIPVDRKQRDSVLEEELNKYFQHTHPCYAETTLMKDLIVLVHGDDYKDATLDYLVEHFHEFVKSITDKCMTDLQYRDKVQQYLGLSTDEEISEYKISKQFNIICQLGEMKTILCQLLPFKAICCVYHRLRETVHFTPKREGSIMSKVLQELKRHDII